MTTSPPAVRPGYVRGALSARALRRVLRGSQSLEDVLTHHGSKPPQQVHYDRMTSGTLVGFLLHPEQPREIIVAMLPFTRQTVPAITLLSSSADWEAVPQLISKDYLLRHEAVALRADWLSYLINLAVTLENAMTRSLGVDKTSLAIGTAWERWEHDNLTWPQRCSDLARLTGLEELKPNTLLNKCKRGGLLHGDNKARPASAT